MVLDLLDKIIQLLDRRQRRREKLLSDVLEPIFLELRVVHLDYMEMLEGARSQLAEFLRWRAERLELQDRPSINRQTFSSNGWLVPEEEGFEVVARVGDIARELEQRRLKLEADRVHLRQMIAAAMNADGLEDEARSFLQEAREYSPRVPAESDGVAPGYSLTATMWLAHVLRDLINDYKASDVTCKQNAADVMFGIRHTIGAIDALLVHIRSTWRTASQSYETAKLALKTEP